MDGPDMSLTENESITISNIPTKIHELKFKFLSLCVCIYINTNPKQSDLIYLNIMLLTNIEVLLHMRQQGR